MGSSEFQAAFEKVCQERGLRLFVLPPCSPKLNGCVEKAHRTHNEEFYEVYDGELEMPLLNQALKEWEVVYNTVPPRGYPTTPLITSSLKSILDGATQSWPPKANCLICSERVQGLVVGAI